MGDLDIVGMPVISGKIVVLDPRDVNSMTDKIRTYVYDAKTAAVEYHAPIPVTSMRVKLTSVSFRRFTKTSSGAQPPAIVGNPMIGPDPFGGGGEWRRRGWWRCMGGNR